MPIFRHLILPGLALILLVGATSAQANGGFESGLSFWSSNPAGNISLNTTPDRQFPTEGNLFARVEGSGGPGIVGHGPHIPGGGAGQATVLSRTFIRPAGPNCEAQIDWTFFQAESGANPFADFLSIDIIDVATNSLVVNMVFLDNGSAAGIPAYNGVPGAGNGSIPYVKANSDVFSSLSNFEPVPVGLKRAWADLSAVAPGTMLRLDVAVSNGGDSSAPSTAYVDNFKVLAGGSNSSKGALRVLGGSHVEGIQSSFGSGGDFQVAGPIDFSVRPGQRIAVRASADIGGLGWALLAGTVRNDGADFGFERFNLAVAGGIDVVIDGLNPVTPIDALLGTLVFPASFIEGQVPIDALDGTLGLTAVVEDPTAFPLFIEGTATTRIEISSADRIPTGATQVLDSGGAPLSDDDFGTVDLSAMNGGSGFFFYGLSYTQCFVSSNGFITFGSGDTGFFPTINAMFTGAPRVAVCWDDFDPSLSSAPLIEASASADFVTISWSDLSQFSDDTGANNFSIQLHRNGTIVCYYDSLTTDGCVIGISRGGLSAPSNPVSTASFSVDAARDGGSVSFSGSSPAIEFFGINGATILGASDVSDIMTLGVNGPSRISYVPEVGGGYRVISGVR